MRATLYGVLLLCACSNPGAKLPSKVGVDLVSATSTAQYRLLVFRVCKADPCASDTYLQWLDGWPPEVIHTRRIPELGKGQVVRSVRWAHQGGRVSAVAVVDPQYEDREPVTLHLLPGPPGSYEVVH